MLNVATSLSRGHGHRLLANAVRKIEEEDLNCISVIHTHTQIHILCPTIQYLSCFFLYFSCIFSITFRASLERPEIGIFELIPNPLYQILGSHLRGKGGVTPYDNAFNVVFRLISCRQKSPKFFTLNTCHISSVCAESEVFSRDFRNQNQTAILPPYHERHRSGEEEGCFRGGG